MSVAGISTIFSFLIKYSRNVSESNDCAMACTRFPPLPFTVHRLCASVCALVKHFSLLRDPATTTPNVVCHFKSVPWVASEVELWAKGSRRKWHCRTQIQIPPQLPLPYICECANNKVKMKWLGTNGKASVYMKSWVGLELWVCDWISKKQKGKGLVTNTHTHTEPHSRSLCTFWQPMKRALIAPTTLS